MNKRFGVVIAISVLMSCVLFVHAIQLPTYASTTAVKKDASRTIPPKSKKIARIPASSNFEPFIRDIISASNACIPTTQSKIGKRTLATLTVDHNTNSVNCKELIALVQSNIKVATTGGVVELPLLAQIFNAIVGAGAGLTSAGVAAIAGVIVIVLLIIGLTWCLAYAEKCKHQYDSIKRSLDDFFDTHVLSMLKSWTKDPQQAREIERSVKSNLEKEWNDTKKELNRGTSPSKIRDQLQRKLSNTPSLPPSNNTPPQGNGTVPPRASASNEESRYSESFLTKEELNQIRASDLFCAEALKELQNTLRKILEPFSDLTPEAIKKLRKNMSDVIDDIINKIGNDLYNLRKALQSAKGKMPEIREGKSLDELINSLPKNQNIKMTRKEAINLYKSLHKYLNLEKSVLYKPHQTLNVRPHTIDEMLFAFLSDLHFVLILPYIDFNNAMINKKKLCDMFTGERREQLLSDALFNCDYISQYLLDIKEALKNKEDISNLCLYASSYKDFAKVAQMQIVGRIRNTGSTYYLNDSFYPIMGLRNFLSRIITKINVFLEKLK